MGFEPSYYPKFWEGMILLLTSLELVAAGSIIKRHWTRNNEPLPIALAVLLWLLMATLYFTVAAAFYQTTAPHRTFTVLMYCLLFWVLPVGYFTRTLVHAVAMQTVDRIGPFSARIEDPSEFAAARKLALRGDIDGAVARYREYGDNHATALFEAARLLKSEDRFEDAAKLYQEVAELYCGRRRVWAEATHNLAKLYETALNNRAVATELHRKILDRAPDTRFGHLAGADLGRLLVLDGEVAAMDVQDASPAVQASPDPFYRPRDVYPVEEVETPAADAVPLPAPTAATESADDIDLVIPVEDPFLQLRRKARTLAADAEITPDNGDPTAGAAPRRRAAKPRPKRKPGASKKKPGAGRGRKP